MAGMNAWFTPEHTSLFAFVSLISLLYLLEGYAERGRRRTLVLSICSAVLLGGIGFLAAASLAHQQAQPQYVYGALTTTGILVTLGGAFGLLRVLYLYRNAGREPVAGIHRQPFEHWQ